MKLLYLKPPGYLSGFVDHYFIYELDEGEVAKEFPDGMQILPSIHGRMGFFFGEPTIKRVEGKRKGRNPRIGISGFYTEPRNYISEGAVSMLIVGFTPCGLQHLIQFPLCEVMNLNLDARDLFPDHNQLLNQVYECGDWNRRIQAVNAFLGSKYSSKEPDKRAENALNGILHSKGRLSVRDTASGISVSERTLHRMVTRNTGVSTKVFTRLVRFQAAARMLVSSSDSHLTALAYQAGYYDQAHFIHDFSVLFGRPPGTLAGLKRSAIGKYFDRYHEINGFASLPYV